MVAAYVEESAQNQVSPPDDEDWLSGELGSDVLARPTKLVGATHHLPGSTKNRAALQV